MTVEIKRTKKPNEVDVYYKGKLLAVMFYDPKDKTYGVMVEDNSFWDFPTKEKAIGKALHYYGFA